MIDVHCLIHRESDFFPFLKEQMEKEKDIIFHVIQNDNNIGLGRVKGFLSGECPYVSFVDYDDLIVPGIFTKLNDILQSYDWAYTDEMLIDEGGKEIQPGWSSNPDLYPPTLLEFHKFDKGHCHHLIAFKRNLLEIQNYYIMMQLFELPETYLLGELARHENFHHLKEIGYFWRQHKDNVFKTFRAWKELNA